jgi:DNA-binding transcriptional MerR regulator
MIGVRRITTLADDLKREMPGLTAQKLRYWERLGLIQPNRSLGSQRVYTEVDVERIRIIVNYQKQGKSLPEISQLLQTSNAQYEDVRPTEFDVLMVWGRDGDEPINSKRSVELTQNENMVMALGPVRVAITLKKVGSTGTAFIVPEEMLAVMEALKALDRVQTPEAALARAAYKTLRLALGFDKL